MKKHDAEFIARKAVETVLNGELGDYSYFGKWEYEHMESYGGEVYIDVEFPEIASKGLKFKVDPEKIDTDDEDDYHGEIEIEMGEDSYEVFVTYDHRVKYFWMALLNWN
tara:strand:+ start:321 stop:647 length:327 start_codon:yes stop_codon:yes gene_type:complete